MKETRVWLLPLVIEKARHFTGKPPSSQASQCYYHYYFQWVISVKVHKYNLPRLACEPNLCTFSIKFLLHQGTENENMHGSSKVKDTKFSNANLLCLTFKTSSTSSISHLVWQAKDFEGEFMTEIDYDDNLQSFFYCYYHYYYYY